MAAATGVILARVATRLRGRSCVPDDSALEEMITTVSDRVLIRIGRPDLSEVPKAAHSIVADATVKMVNLAGYEGVSSESVGEGGSISTSFVDGVLNEYEADFAILKSMNFDRAGNPIRKTVRFL
ncbi:MAG: hypothetical protein RR547_00515 [Raoultibacter sp.]